MKKLILVSTLLSTVAIQAHSKSIDFDNSMNGDSFSISYPNGLFSDKVEKCLRDDVQYDPPLDTMIISTFKHCEKKTKENLTNVKNNKNLKSVIIVTHYSNESDEETPQCADWCTKAITLPQLLKQ
ncbi:hypothetical protein [Lonepinella sp. BR2474]|uniref:hypothetical protein n=1 Tax=Lonepinella sp. BR2474 TaxID=3434548 RepID=UPI003F6DA8E2